MILKDYRYSNVWTWGQKRGVYWKINKQNVKLITYFKRNILRPFKVFTDKKVFSL